MVMIGTSNLNVITAGRRKIDRHVDRQKYKYNLIMISISATVIEYGPWRGIELWSKRSGKKKRKTRSTAEPDDVEHLLRTAATGIDKST